MADRLTCDIWLTVDSDGQWSVADDREAALERHSDDNGIDGALAIHRIRLSVPLPVDQLATITLPDDATGEPIVMAE